MATRTRAKPKPNGAEDIDVGDMLELEAPRQKARSLKAEEIQARMDDIMRLARGQGIVLVTFVWRGITPLLMNKRGLIEPPSMMRSRIGDDHYAKWERAMAQSRGELDSQAYWDSDGLLCVPLLNCRKCTVEGAMDEKLPWNERYNLKTIMHQAIRTDIAYFPLYQHLEMTPEGAVLKDRILRYEKHEIGGRNPGDWRHQGVNIVRPAIPAPWYLQGSFRVDLRQLKGNYENPELKDVALVRDCMKTAGDAIGLGDWRQLPSGGPMGKFALVGLKVEKMPHEEEDEDELMTSWAVV